MKPRLTKLLKIIGVILVVCIVLGAVGFSANEEMLLKAVEASLIAGQRLIQLAGRIILGSGAMRLNSLLNGHEQCLGD